MIYLVIESMLRTTSGWLLLCKPLLIFVESEGGIQYSTDQGSTFQSGRQSTASGYDSRAGGWEARVTFIASLMTRVECHLGTLHVTRLRIRTVGLSKLRWRETF